LKYCLRFGKLLGFNARILNSSNDIILNYQIQPKDRKKLINKEYTMTLEIKMEYTSTTSMSYLSMHENKVIYDYVSIVLTKANGYMVKDKKKLRKISTFQRALGVNMTTNNFRPSVRVVSIN